MAQKEFNEEFTLFAGIIALVLFYSSVIYSRNYKLLK